MAPEQVRGAQADHRSDILAFGTVAYEMLSGQRAFQREVAVETMTAILRDDPRELATTRLDFSPALGRIVHHCLEKNPTERFQTARDIAFALEQLSGATSSTAMEAIPAVPRRMRFLRWVVAGAGIAAAVAAIFLRGSPIQPPAADAVLASVAILSFFWFPELSPDGRRLASVGWVGSRQCGSGR